MLPEPPDEGPRYPAFDLVVVAASAGGLRALVPLIVNLPADLPTPVMLVQHLPPSSRYVSRLPEVLQRSTSLQVKWAEDQELLRGGRIYVAPQDGETFFDPQTGCLRVSRVAGWEGQGPAADPLFRSAAQVFGSRVVAVVLSGVLSDGADGAAAIARAGGRVLAQISSEAQFGDMPHAAMKRSGVGLAFDCASLARVISSLVMMPGAATWFGIGKAGVCARLLLAYDSRRGPGSRGVCADDAGNAEPVGMSEG